MQVSNHAVWINPIVSLTSADILRAEPSKRTDGSAAVNVVFTDAGATKMREDRKSTRLNSSHSQISYAVFCLKKKKLRQHVSLHAEPIADLDFKSIFLRLAYATVGIALPAEDLYRRLASIATAAHRTGIQPVV